MNGGMIEFFPSSCWTPHLAAIPFHAKLIRFCEFRPPSLPRMSLCGSNWIIKELFPGRLAVRVLFRSGKHDSPSSAEQTTIDCSWGLYVFLRPFVSCFSEEIMKLVYLDNEKWCPLCFSDGFGSCGCRLVKSLLNLFFFFCIEINRFYRTSYF